MPKAPPDKARRNQNTPRSAPSGASRRGAPASPARAEARQVTRAAPPPRHLEDPVARAERHLRGGALLMAPVLASLAGVVLLVLGLFVPGALLIALGVIVLLGGVLIGSPRRVIAALGGRAASEPEDARLINVVEGLCVATGLAVPHLVVLEDPAANAIVLGTAPDAATLVCTTGLLRILDRMELEGLVAHELAHLKRGDTRASGLAMITLGLASLLLPHPGRLLRRVGDPAREVGADLLAAAMTRYPPGLRQTLEKLEAAPLTRPKAVNARLQRLTGPFWCAPLDDARGEAARTGVFDLTLRAAALAEL